MLLPNATDMILLVDGAHITLMVPKKFRQTSGNDWLLKENKKEKSAKQTEMIGCKK